MITILIFIVVLGILIFVHELGHFVIAKICGVYVDCFSLGFGPRIIGITVGETEYRISAIPLGGYVRMAGQFDVPEEYDQEAADRYKSVPRHRRYDAQSIPRRMAIIIAGPLMNLLFALPIAFLLLVNGEQQSLSFDATTIGSVIPGSPAVVAGMVPGDKIISIGGTPVTDWRQTVMSVRSFINTDTTITYQRGAEILTAPIRPGFDREKGYLGIGAQQMQRAQVADIQSNTPAAESGLKIGDVVDRLIGLQSTEISYYTLIAEIQRYPNTTLVFGVKRFKPVRYADESNSFETARIVCGTERAGKFDNLSLQSYHGTAVFVRDPGAPTNFPAKTGDRIISVNGRKFLPEALQEYVWSLPDGDVPVVLERVTGQLIKTLIQTNLVLHVGSIGRIGTTFVEASQKVRYTPLEALKESPRLCYAQFSELMQVLKLIITGKIGLESLAGPIGIARMTGEAARAGFTVLLGFVLLITVNLGVLNLLPVPVLDGGHVVLLFIEALWRKPLSARFVLMYQKLGFLVILGLIGLVVYQDVYNILLDNEAIGLLLGRIVQMIKHIVG